MAEYRLGGSAAEGIGKTLGLKLKAKLSELSERDDGRYRLTAHADGMFCEVYVGRVDDTGDPSDFDVHVMFNDVGLEIVHRFLGGVLTSVHEKDWNQLTGVDSTEREASSRLPEDYAYRVGLAYMQFLSADYARLTTYRKRGRGNG